MTDKLNEAQRSFVKWYVKNTLTRGRNRRDLERLIKEGEKLPIWTCSTVVEDRPVLEYLQYRVKYEQDKLKPSKSMLQLFEEEKQKKMEK